MSRGPPVGVPGLAHCHSPMPAAAAASVERYAFFNSEVCYAIDGAKLMQIVQTVAGLRRVARDICIARAAAQKTGRKVTSDCDCG